MWFFKIFRSFFFAIDSILFNFIPTVYSWIETISRISILSNGQIHNFANRIQLLLGVFMLFKVVLSLITYILNPDEFGDKGKGLGKLWLNIIFTLILLVVTPYFFNMAYDLQTMVLEDNTLANVLFGDQTDSSINSNFKNNAGQEIAYSVMIPFFTPATTNDNNTNYDLSECNNFVNEDGNFNENCLLAMAEETNDDEISFELAPFYFGLLPGAVYNIVTNVSDDVNENIIMVNNYATGVSKKNLGLTFRGDIARLTTDNGKDFVIDYKFGLSTVAAVVVILVLISFCLDVALRSVKLAFLQLIAPIPIISFIDPKQGKDGLFKKWYTMCFSTYISLFVRLLGLYFGVYLIGAVINSDGPFDIVTGKTVNNIWIKLMMIIGILMFVKQLPKILEGLGIKLEGGGKFTLNPFKKFEEEAAGGKQILGAAGGLVSGIADRGARIATAQGTANKLKAAAGGLIGIPGAAIRGFKDGKGFTSGMKAQNAVNRRLREGRIKGLTPLNSYLDYAGSLFGLDNATLEAEGSIIHKNREAIENKKREVEDLNRDNTIKIERMKKDEVTRTRTDKAINNVKSQSESLLNFADNFASTKADLGVATGDQDLVDHLTKYKGKKTGAITIGGKTFAAGSTIDDDMIAWAKSYANRNNVSSTRRANEANVKNLINHNGETLNSSFYINGVLFKKDSVIDGNLIALAQSEQEKYIKDSTKLVFDELAQGSSSHYYGASQPDVEAFKNIESELKDSVNVANASVDAYNMEYGTSLADFGSVLDSSGQIDYGKVKAAKGNYSSGATITDIRTSAAKVQSDISELEREIEKNRRDAKVEYFDENNVAQIYDLDKADSLNKPREEKHKEKIKQHDESRAFFQNRSS